MWWSDSTEAFYTPPLKTATPPLACVVEREEVKEEEEEEEETVVVVEVVVLVVAADFSDGEQRQPVNLKPSFRSIFSWFSIIGQIQICEKRNSKK